MRYRLIEAEKAEHAISRLCGVLGVTRQGLRLAAARSWSASLITRGSCSTSTIRLMTTGTGSRERARRSPMRYLVLR
jgi:hypothetical protein